MRYVVAFLLVAWLLWTPVFVFERFSRRDSPYMNLVVGVHASLVLSCVLLFSGGYLVLLAFLVAATGINWLLLRKARTEDREQ